MLSTSNLERLIAVKRREIAKEKSDLGLATSICQNLENDKENTDTNTQCIKKVHFIEETQQQQHHDSSEDQEKNKEESQREFEEIPPDLERYIRRYLGLPVMLKAGEYSPNNPLVRSERAVGDALLGLGEYERRRNTLRKIRQHEYKEYLDQQAKKKQEAKQQAERERREREQKERERQEREREILLERDSFSPDRRRSVPVNIPLTSTVYCNSKVDTGVQVEGFSKPLSVAVQTDDAELFGNVQYRAALTQAERELSPRGASDVPRRRSHGDYDRLPLPTKSNREKLTSDLRHTYMPSIFDADAIRLRNMQAEKEAAERRQYYQQELKNQILEQQRIREERKSREKMLEQAEMRRIEEQLRMLRLAQEGELEKQHEMNVTMTHNTSDYNTKRRALQNEIDAEKHKFLRAVSQPIENFPKRNTTTSKSDTHSKLPFYYPKDKETRNEFNKKPYSINIPENSIFSSNYDVDSYLRRNLNFNKEKIHNYDDQITRKSENKFNHDEKISNNINQPRFDMRCKSNIGNFDKYERNGIENFNSKLITARNQEIQTKNNDGIPNKDNNSNKSLTNTKINTKNIQNPHEIDETDIESDYKIKHNDVNRNVFIEKALIHDRPKPQASTPSVEIDSLPIPVLRHTPRSDNTEDCRIDMSEAMKKVDDKWQVPAVQKNILKALPTQEGKTVSILTQLGSIRRQLQLEQLKLDRMMKKDD